MKPETIFTLPLPRLSTFIPLGSPPVMEAADTLMTPELSGCAETKIGVPLSVRGSFTYSLTETSTEFPHCVRLISPSALSTATFSDPRATFVAIIAKVSFGFLAWVVALSTSIVTLESLLV